MGRESSRTEGFTLVNGDWGPPDLSVPKGECQAIASQTGIGRRSRSKVRVRVVGWTSMGWVEAFEAWGVALKALVVNIPDKLKNIRPLLTTVPITTP